MAEQLPVDQLMALAIRAAREKRRQEARQMLLQVIERDERNEQAWLWLSGVVDDPRDMQVAVANALTINPRNEQARKGLDMLRQRYGNLLQPEEEPPPAVAPAPVAAPAPVPAAEEAEVRPARPTLRPTAAAPAPAAAQQEEEEVFTFSCYSCRAEINSMAGFCWKCHAVVHCCRNCVRQHETACKESIGIRGPAAAKAGNRCPDWRPPRS